MAWNDIFVKKYSKISNAKLFGIMKQVERNERIDSPANLLAIRLGQLYGLEKFWAFLKYSKEKPKVNPKLEEILKHYQRLEDFRVDGASFPQQFYPTKSGIIVRRSPFSNILLDWWTRFQTVPAPEAIAAASNSFKSSGEYFPARHPGQANRRAVS